MPPKKVTPSPAAAPPNAVKSSIHSSASSAPTKPSSANLQQRQSQNQQQSSFPTADSKSTSSRSNTSSSAALRTPQDAQQILLGIWNSYVDKTPQRTKLLDTFMAFLMLVGVLQFVYCVIAGNYPFNAFLSGFSATVGQFVLTASLRIQTNPENKSDFKTISDERAFADFVFGSMILHFFCVNFIN
ncbi:oligosaccharyltransferase complex subunit epsilon [Recurvomyces mirabilis]|uniref:Dolichyl-diphosphooligosaccharide--protein glycosyltransferase subunit OST2 n=1 Tax=Recurvomyces mirabilis TaxID=574656 RepID=A0AAE0TU95_9PEZI|nr:oligosaccharyltransferase complex subunit epsilon [Recurvomyces mirabilis]KAK5155772.1 oligosaccharyltransferase complex subunit epsilon [Recurvomyces mirabilis]